MAELSLPVRLELKSFRTLRQLPSKKKKEVVTLAYLASLLDYFARNWLEWESTGVSTSSK